MKMKSFESYEIWLEIEKQLQGHASFNAVKKVIESIIISKQNSIEQVVFGIQLSLENMEILRRK